MTRYRLGALLLMLAAAAGTPFAHAQSSQVPDPRSLTPGWWTFMAEADGDALGARASELIASAEAAAAPGTTRPEIADDLERLRVNLRALPALKLRAEPVPQPPPALRPAYTLDEYLAAERMLRQLRRNLAAEEQDNARQQSAIAVAERRLDSIRAGYLAMSELDAARLGTGLKIMASRAALAVSEEQLRFARAAEELHRTQVRDLASLVDHAREHLSGAAEELERAPAELDAASATLETAQARLRTRQAEAIGLTGDSALERAEASYRALLEIEARSQVRLAELKKTLIEQRALWARLDPQATQPTDLVEIEARLAAADMLNAEALAEAAEWEKAADRELAALRQTGGEQDAALERLNRQRLELVQQTLRAVEAEREARADLAALTAVVRERLVRERGAIATGLAALWSSLGRAAERTSDWLSFSLFKLGDTPVTSFGLLRVLLILFVAFWISRLLRGAIARFSRSADGQTESAYYTIGRLAHYLIITLALVIGLASIGLGFSNLALVAGALGVGIGFGLQSIVSNFVSGLIILFERSLKVGDYVELDSGVSGLVKEINVRSTLVNTNENLDVLVPNSEFVSGKVTNWTLKEASRRMHVPFGVAYGSDKELVRRAGLEAAERVEYTVRDEPRRKPQVWLVGFGDSSLDFELVVWVTQAAVRRPGLVVASYLWELETALAEHGIEIPFPQRDLHLRSGFTSLGDGQAAR